VYGDFSRVLDPRADRYSAVLAQQGRLLLDAELNEQTSILLEYMRRLTTDLVGPFAGPARGAGFSVHPVQEGGKCRAVRLGAGHYYVFGVRCEAPAPGHGADAEVALGGDHEVPFVVYLTAWEESVSWISAPDLAEPALGVAGTDTTRRLQVRWQLSAGRRLPGSTEELTALAPEQIAAAFRHYDTAAAHRPRLGARAVGAPPAASGPETTPTAAAYRGAENQLYRVEVHRGGSAQDATFKWSRDNGSVEFAVGVLGDLDGEGVRRVTVREGSQDAHRGLEVGDWVELVDDHSHPFGDSSPLMQVRHVTAAIRELTLADTRSDRAFHLDRHPLLRRWDQPDHGSTPHHGIPLEGADGSWLELEDGIEVQFTEADARYQRGDFWLIPARAATGGLLWPTSREQPYPLALPPNGPSRFLAPLALVTSLTAAPVDLRTRFQYVVAGAGETAAAKPAPTAEPSTGEATGGGPPPDDEHRPDDEQRPPGEQAEEQAAVEQERPLQPPPPTADATVIRPDAVRFGLRSLSSFENGMVFDLPIGEIRLGRDATAGIRIQHPDVSRDHASFTVTSDGVDVRDLDSKNGTWVNDKRLAAHEGTALKAGDQLTLGTEEVVLGVLDADPPTPPPADDPPTDEAPTKT
jgi:hypothetical protein